MEVQSGALQGKPGNHQKRGGPLMQKHSEGVTSNTLRKFRHFKMQ